MYQHKKKVIKEMGIYQPKHYEHNRLTLAKLTLPFNSVFSNQNVDMNQLKHRFIYSSTIDGKNHFSSQREQKKKKVEYIQWLPCLNLIQQLVVGYTSPLMPFYSI